MAITFTVEDGTGVVGANSYASLEDAEDYIGVKPNSAAWADSDDQEAYLMWATRLLDQRVRWAGCKAAQANALAWPRLYVYDREGFVIAPTELPKEVKAATIEIAYHLFSQAVDPSAASSSGGGGIKRIKADVLEIEYQDGASSSSSTPFPIGLNAILSPLGTINTGGAGFGRILRS